MRVMRRSLALALILVAASVVGFGSVSAAEVSPITPANRPTPLPGTVNGVVPPSRLVQVAPNCIAVREAAPSLRRIFTMARQANVALGAEECYRALAEEVRLGNLAQQPGNNPACVASVAHAPSGQPVGTSYHGWGKAVDLTDAGRSLTFNSAGYAFMKQVAGSVGWNHPAFAEPGGSACPEAWHWEWVGDGGTLHAGTKRGDVVALLPSADDHGYATVTGLGALGVHGNFVSRGSVANIPIAWVTVGAAPAPHRDGYWMVAADGGVFSFGSAHFRGSMGGKKLVASVNGMASTRTGSGYWLVASDGGLFSFGDARFFGSMGGRRLVSPVVGMASTPSGKGYWLVASDGGVFSFGDARFNGSLAPLHPTSPTVAIVPTKTGRGYWIELADGSVGALSDARFFGNG
ncbi:MAG: hypothetical protein JWL83_2937 [Actinomycetia bacterium]|nr:hypothetical protein [Actinomycetes bacterium]